MQATEQVAEKSVSSIFEGGRGTVRINKINRLFLMRTVPLPPSATFSATSEVASPTMLASLEKRLQSLAIFFVDISLPRTPSHEKTISAIQMKPKLMSLVVSIGSRKRNTPRRNTRDGERYWSMPRIEKDVFLAA